MRKDSRFPVMLRLLRAATILSVGGVVAGCSSGSVRFSDALYTSAVPQARQSSQQASYGQPNYNPGVDRTATGSINGQGGPKPSVPVAGAAPVGNAGASYTPPPAQTAAVQPVSSSPVTAGPTMAAPATNNGVQATSTPTQSASREKGWSTIGGTAVTVGEGDTIYSIASRYSVPAKAVISANGISDPKSVKVGQKVIIPTYSAGVSSTQSENRQVASAAPASQSMNDGSSASASSGTYTVTSGDTLSGIASRTGSSVAAIKRVNGLNSDVVRLGQKLTIPGRSSSEMKQVASAQVDPVVTSNPEPAEKQTKVAEYTPPKSDSEENVRISEIDKTETASAPKETGVTSLRWPVKGRVVSGFGSDNGGKPNDGIDISVPSGTPVKAAENGVVIYAGDGLKELGNTILVRHEDGIVTVYGHASTLKVKRGDTVSRGQEIASSGMSGAAKQPQLHFEVRKNSSPVNPTSYLQ